MRALQRSEPGPEPAPVELFGSAGQVIRGQRPGGGTGRRQEAVEPRKGARDLSSGLLPRPALCLACARAGAPRRTPPRPRGNKRSPRNSPRPSGIAEPKHAGRVSSKKEVCPNQEKTCLPRHNTTKNENNLVLESAQRIL